MKREAVDLFALAKETVNSLQAEAESAHVTMSLDGEPAVISKVLQLL